MPTENLCLPDVKSITTEGQKLIDGQLFPLVLTPTVDRRDCAAWQDWIRQHLDRLKQLLVDHGAIVFRGFSTRTPADFDAFTKTFGWPEFPYLGGLAVRLPIVGNVYTATEAAPEHCVLFHHEMAHVADHPKVLTAYCDVEPGEGGETPLAVSHAIYTRMLEREPEFVRRLEAEGVRYLRVASDVDDIDSIIGRSWKSTFFAKDRETCEKNAREAGFEYEWLPNGNFKYISAPLKAIRLEPRTGKQTWFNSVYQAYFGWEDSRNKRRQAVTFPSGDQMPEDAMNTLHKVLTEEASASLPWRKEDAVMVDNMLVMHARNPFKPPRRVYVSLFKN